MNKKIALIFGSSGQDGSLMCKTLLKKNYIVYAASRGGNFLSHKKISIFSKTRKVYINYFIKNEISKIINKTNCDEIYYLAGQSSLYKSFELSRSTILSHTLPVYNILSCILEKRKKIKFFNSGSGLIYDSKITKINEKTKLKPNTPYGIAKLISYMLVKYYREKHNLYAFTGIFFNHESKLRRKEFLIPKILDYLKYKKYKYKKLTLGNINVFKDWGWAEEYMEIVYKLMQKSKPKDIIIATGQSKSIKHVLNKAFKNKKMNWRKHVKIDKNLFRKKENKKVKVDISYLKKILGYQPKIKIDHILKLMS